MGQNKLLIVPNDTYSKIYCSKCLGLLGDDRVKDHENNEFCCWECKVEYWVEMRQDMNDILSEFK